MGCGSSAQPVMPAPDAAATPGGDESKAQVTPGGGGADVESKYQVAPPQPSAPAAPASPPRDADASARAALAPAIVPGSGGAAVPMDSSLGSVQPLQQGGRSPQRPSPKSGLRKRPLSVAVSISGNGAGPDAPLTPHGAMAAAPSAWKKGELIGAGAYGRVYIGLNEQTGGLMAVKEVRYSPEDTEEVESLRNEIELMRSLAHENIVRYIGTQVDPSQRVLNIFTEWVPGGSIHALVKKFGRLADSVIQKYTSQMLAGLKYLHDKKVVHRDIKGANILVTDLGIIKLADFGASKDISGGTLRMQQEAEGAQPQKSNKLHGTPNFMAPEVRRGRVRVRGERRERGWGGGWGGIYL